MRKLSAMKSQRTSGAPNTGTLGVLAAAAQNGLLDLRSAVDRLRRTNFHIAQNILDHLIGDQP